MQLLMKLETSPLPQVPNQRSRNAEPSRQAMMLSNLQTEPNFDYSAEYLMFPGKFKTDVNIVKGHLWTTLSLDTSSIPLIIFDALHNTKALANTRNEITRMELIEKTF